MRVLSILLLGLVGVSAVAWADTPKADLKLKTGDAAPSFKATNVDGKSVSLETFKDSDVVVVVFTCNGCPVAQAYQERLVEFANKYKDKHVSLVAINNSASEDVEAMKERAKDEGFTFDYAYDGSGESARAYGAKVTPHCFVLNKERHLVYQGAFDDSQSKPSEHYVTDAVESTLAGKSVAVDHKAAFGCGIHLKDK